MQTAPLGRGGDEGIIAADRGGVQFRGELQMVIFPGVTPPVTIGLAEA